MRHLLRGLRSGIGLFRTSPASAITAVLALTLGLGFSTTMFGIVQGATRSLPVDHPEQIVAITKVPTSANGRVTTSRGVDLTTWRAAAAGQVQLEAYLSGAFNVSDRGGDVSLMPERISGVWVTPGTFIQLGATPAAGRVLTDADASAGAPPVVVISHALWTRRFDAAPDVVGRVLRLDGAPYTIAGVMPPRFGFPIRSDVWLPFSPVADQAVGLQVWGRLADGATRAAVEQSLSAATRRLGEERPHTHAGLDAHVIPFTEIETPREVLAALYVMLLAVSGVLVIACVNVANLFLARAAARARETAVRLALGASRRILLLEHAGEAIALAGLACVAGLGIAVMGTAIFAANTAHIIEAYWVRFSVDGWTLLWAAALALIAAVLSAVLPAWRAARADVVQTLRDGAGATRARASRTSRALVTAQIAFACALLALTLLLGRSAMSLQQREWPFPADRILSTHVSIPQATMDDTDARHRLLTALAAELESLPNVRGGLASALPGRGAGSWLFGLDTAPGDKVATGTTSFTLVSPGYFATLGASALRGRLLTGADGPAAPPVAVVNESFIRRFSPDRDPIGRRFVIGERQLTIVGVVADLMPADIQDTRQDGVYGSISQLRPFSVNLLAEGATARMLRAAVDRVDPDLPLHETFPVREAALRDKQVLTVLSGLFGVFGAGALVMTAIGLYSVMAVLVALRTREFGIRLALGASPHDLFTLVAFQGGRQVVVGLVLGVALGLALTMVFSSAVEAVTVKPAGLIAGVVGGLLATAALALAVPTWTATRLDPVKALKAE